MKTILLQRKDIHRGNLILVNREHALINRETMLTDLNAIGKEERLVPAFEGEPSVLLSHRAASLLAKLMEEIGGWKGIVPVSGWRSQREQQEIWNSSLAEHGQAFTEKYVAWPGHSEHQTGLAIDLGRRQEKVDFICPDFPDSGICRTFRRRAVKYGFIERYPEGREAVTGIGYEPWHFRYVGMPHAAIMEQEGLVFEEYIAFLRQFPYGKRPYLFRQGSQELQVSYLPFLWEENTTENTEPERGKEGRWMLELKSEPTVPYLISGNNVDGFILTEYAAATVSVSGYQGKRTNRGNRSHRGEEAGCVSGRVMEDWIVSG